MIDPEKWKLPFGSYKGRALGEVYKTDPSYVAWLRDEASPPASTYAEALIRKKNKEIIERGKP